MKYVAKSVALFSKSIKRAINKHDKKVDFFSNVVSMPISMSPNIMIENFKI